MSLPLDFRPEARRDFDEAFDWCNAPRAGLGKRFADAVDAALRAVAAHPLRNATVHREVRKATVKRFPFAVFYRAEPQRIEALAICHAKRDPGSWRERT